MSSEYAHVSTFKDDILADENTPWGEIVPLLDDLDEEKAPDGRFHGNILLVTPGLGVELDVPVYGTDKKVIYRVRALVCPPSLGLSPVLGAMVGVRGRIITYRKKARVVAIKARAYCVLTTDPRQ